MRGEPRCKSLITKAASRSRGNELPRGGPCGRPPPHRTAGRTHQGVYASLRRATGRPYFRADFRAGPTQPGFGASSDSGYPAKRRTGRSVT